ncbi:MAG TPA: FimV/HubP family polar landmark protein [Dokdonella sp.]|uniref:FimV/HubP family polar landmark protein n=1 Tax=Dokdonella sp. TaxID=2291710 RepID=UPI002CBC52DB|nr:FimV/HubP family polar landmark protein [Dokdonella sp.]HUD41748.1 FimV/HubP family polar landmark protein [Dokdonella sp.]
MKRPLQLSLAIALAISGIDAMALGLGSIQVKSRLNQPLEAEIPVIQSSPGEAEGLIVQLASAEDFERVGLDRTRSAAVPLEFKLVRNAQGQTVIRVTTAEVVRDPFLDLLIEANWPNGRLLREYTVLLDPPVMAAALQGSTTVAASPEPERARIEPLPAATPKPAPKTSSVPPPVARAPAAPPAPRPAAEGDYAVQKGDTLSGIARQVRPDGEVSVDQTMLAIFKANPSAFYKDNINALKSGAILRIPDTETIRAVGSLREAAEQVRGQVEDWRGVSGSPTRIARTSGEADAPAATASPSSRTSDDSRLAIVPPSVGKDSLAASDRVGASSAAGGSGDTRLKNELSRTQEALASREQEAGELKSRVRELEDLKNKNDRLLSLKDSEIAELQQRLKALQDAKGGMAATPSVPATTAPASATPPAATDAPSAPTKDDIWGRGDAATSAPATAEPSATATPVPAPAPTDPVAADPAGSTPPVTPETGTAPPAVPAGDAITATGSDTAPATPPATPAQPPAAAPKPAVKTPPKPVTPPPADSPWFMDPKVLGGAGAIGLLLVLLGVVGLRKRRKPVERSSIAESFGDSPLSAAALAGTAAVAAADPIEAALRAQIDANPADLGARLELLSHFYAERRIEDFQAGALDMNDYVIDRSQPEWLEVQAMGRELLPGHALFAEPGSSAEAAPDANDEAAYDEAFAFDTPVADPFDPAPAPAPVTDFDFDFDAPSPARIEEPVAPPAAAPADDDGFDFGDLPPLDFQSEIDAEARDTAERASLAEDAAPAASLDDEFFVGDDAVNTKLDLARTYLDMGDPDGARAMLEEVLAEGSQVQKDEARRLLDGIV